MKLSLRCFAAFFCFSTSLFATPFENFSSEYYAKYNPTKDASLQVFNSQQLEKGDRTIKVSRLFEMFNNSKFRKFDNFGNENLFLSKTAQNLWFGTKNKALKAQKYAFSFETFDQQQKDNFVPAQILSSDGTNIEINTNPIFIENFGLVNATTNEVIENFSILKDGAIIPIDKVGDQLNIIANLGNQDDANILNTNDYYIDFYLDGKFYRREQKAPFALQGDIPEGNYRPWEFEFGAHILSARLTSNKTGLQLGTPKEINFKIVPTLNQRPTISTISVGQSGIQHWGQRISVQVEAQDPDGDVLTYSATGLPPGISINAVSGLVSGAIDVDQAGGTSTGYNGMVTVMDPNGLSASTDINFFILYAYIQSFSLINSETNLPIAGYEALEYSAVIDLASTGRNLNIQANPYIDEIVGAVVEFTVNGKFERREKSAPYVLAGDLNGNYLNWNPEIGKYTINAKIESAATGMELLGSSGIQIEFIDSSTQDEITMSPNPAASRVKFTSETETVLAYEIYSTVTNSIVKSGTINSSTNSISIESLPKGFYVVNLSSNNTSRQLKLQKM